MPYVIRKLKNGYGKYKKSGGKLKLVSKHKTKAKAKASVRAYYANKK